MADAIEVARGIARRPGTRYTALVPNLRGLAAAHDAGMTEVAIFAAASETFSQRNINQTIEGSLTAYAQVVRDAQAMGLRVRGYLSTAFGCPFEGKVPQARVVELTERLLAMGVFEVAVSDTIGVATPGQVADMVDAVARTRAGRRDCTAPARHARDRARQCVCGARGRRHDVRCVGRGAGRLPLRARCGGQPVDRRSALHAARPRHRNRRRSRRGRARVAVDRAVNRSRLAVPLPAGRLSGTRTARSEYRVPSGHSCQSTPACRRPTGAPPRIRRAARAGRAA